MNVIELLKKYKIGFILGFVYAVVGLLIFTGLGQSGFFSTSCSSYDIESDYSVNNEISQITPECNQETSPIATLVSIPLLPTYFTFYLVYLPIALMGIPFGIPSDFPILVGIGYILNGLLWGCLGVLIEVTIRKLYGFILSQTSRR